MTHNFFFIFPFSTWSLERIHTRDVYYFLIIWFRGSSIFWAWCLEIAGGELYGISPAISLFFHEIVEIAHLPYDTYSSREYPYTDLLPPLSRALRSILLKSYPKCSAKSSSEVASASTVNVPRECRKCNIDAPNELWLLIRRETGATFAPQPPLGVELTIYMYITRLVTPLDDTRKERYGRLAAFILRLWSVLWYLIAHSSYLITSYT